MTATPAIRGFVEGRGAGTIHGWAWDATAPETRLVIELRDGEAVVVRGHADQPRADLAEAGMGDGAHAFRFVLPAALADRVAHLAVLALDGAGTAHPVEDLPAGTTGVPPLAGLQRGLQQIAAAQRATLRLLQSPPPEAPAAQETLAKLAAAQERLEGQIGTLEVFVTRLDARLAALAPQEGPPAPRRGLLAAGLAGAASAAAMSLALARIG